MTSRRMIKMLLLGLALVSFIFGSSYAQNNGVRTQLVIIMDSSGSIASENFQTMIEAVAKSLSDPAVVPQNGSVEVALVQFSHLLRDARTGIPGASTELALTPVDVTTVSEIARRIRGIVQAGGFTPMSQGIRVATELIKAKPRAGARQIFNVISDGNPNLPGGPEQAKEEAIKARDEAVTAGLEQLDAEGIGDVLTDQDFVDFLKALVWPQPGIVIQDGQFPPKGQNGFVIIVREYADLERALRQKLVFMLNEPPVVDPGPIPDGTPDTDPYKCSVGQIITLDGSGSFDPDAAPNNPNKGIAKFEWDFNGDGTTDATGPKVQFTCPNAPGTVTIRLTVTDGVGTTATATQTIQVSPAPPPNQPPRAACSSIDETIVNIKVQLDGSGSSDPEGKSLTYQWSFVSRPADSEAAFEDPASVTTSFTPDKVGSYSVRLTVRDPEGATGTCDLSISVRKTIDIGQRDELGAMKREIISFGRQLPLTAILEKLRLAGNLATGFGAHQRASELVEETQELLDELLGSADDSRTLMLVLVDGVEKIQTRIDALVTANTISTERGNLIKKSLDRLSEYVENAEDRLAEIEDAINRAMELLTESIEDPEMVDAEKIAEARDELLMAFARWRELLNGAIAHIDKASSQLRAALKLAERRRRWRLVKSDFENWLELRAGAHRVQFMSLVSPQWRVLHCGGCTLKVEVYALNGRKIVEQESAGPMLTLHWPQTPANGVYWYLLIIEGPDGQRVQTLGKWAQMR